MNTNPSADVAVKSNVLSTKQKRFVRFVPAAMVVCLVHSVYCYFNGLYPPAIAMFSEIFVLLICMFLYKKQQYDLAGLLTVLSLDILVTFVTYKEGFSTGGYANFFPVITASAFMANVNRVTKISVLTISLSLIFLVATFFISDFEPNGLIYETGVAKQLLSINLLLNFGAVTWFAIVTIIIQRRNNQKLIFARNNAEDANLAKSKFLSIMTHELRTPLNGIIGTTNILLEEERLPAQTEKLRLLQHSSNHMLRMIEGILNYNKLEAGKMELSLVDFNLQQLVKAVSDQFAIPFKAKNIDLQLDFDNSLTRTIKGDDTKIIQILNNLLSNALKFTEKGTVKLTAKKMLMSNQDIVVRFAVTDSGIGINANQQKLIFQDFTQASTDTTRKYGGTGLGLTISKKMIELMGGELHLESKANEGSTFSFDVSFPLSLKQFEETKELILTPARKNNGHKILIAEDNEINAKVIGNFLAKWNLDYEVVVNGYLAVQQMQQNNYGLVLMDLDMPEMNGMTATATLRSWNNHTPVIAFTAALLEKHEFNKLIDSGFNDCVGKPFKPADLYQKIKMNTPASIWNNAA
jgi:signal transduction histidine kinase/CheY-like chemotaxis protein